MPKHVGNTIHNSQTELIIVAFVGFSRIFLLGILIFKGLTARRLYKSFDVKGLIVLLSVHTVQLHSDHNCLKIEDSTWSTELPCMPVLRVITNYFRCCTHPL
jgi:hypothetical protein